MRTIITGSKTVVIYSDLLDAIENAPFKITSIVSGIIYWGDQLGERYAAEKNLPIKQIDINRTLQSHHNKLEYSRMVEMVGNADALIVLWSGMSKDTQTITRIARRKGVAIFIWYLKSIINDETSLISW